MISTATPITQPATNGMTWTQAASFWVAGEPKAVPKMQARAMVIGSLPSFRAACTMKDIHALVRGQLYDPGTADEWRASIMRAAMPHVPDIPLEGPVRLDWTAYFPRPKYMTLSKFGPGPVPHAIRPDEDNLTKPVGDSLTRQGWWKDDGQMWAGPREKYYHAIGGSPGMLVELWTLEEQAGLFGGGG